LLFTKCSVCNAVASLSAPHCPLSTVGVVQTEHPVWSPGRDLPLCNAPGVPHAAHARPLASSESIGFRHQPKQPADFIRPVRDREVPYATTVTHALEYVVTVLPLMCAGQHSVHRYRRIHMHGTCVALSYVECWCTAAECSAVEQNASHTWAVPMVRGGTRRLPRWVVKKTADQAFQTMDVVLTYRRSFWSSTKGVLVKFTVTYVAV
jgi:hypothetical protein